jgi:hypothetical protein
LQHVADQLGHLRVDLRGLEPLDLACHAGREPLTGRVTGEGEGTLDWFLQWLPLRPAVYINIDGNKHVCSVTYS